jgi:hypothetical protein
MSADLSEIPERDLNPWRDAEWLRLERAVLEAEIEGARGELAYQQDQVKYHRLRLARSEAHLATHDARSKLHGATADRRGWVLAEAEVVRCEDAEESAQSALDKLKTRAHASNYDAIAKLRKLADERFNALTAEWHRRHPAKADQPAGEP